MLCPSLSIKYKRLKDLVGGGVMQRSYDCLRSVEIKLLLINSNDSFDCYLSLWKPQKTLKIDDIRQLIWFDRVVSCRVTTLLIKKVHWRFCILVKMRNKGEVLVSSESKGQMWNTGVWDSETGTLLTSYKGGSTLNRTLSMVGTDYIVSAHPDKPLLNVWQINRNEQMSLRMFTPGKCSALTCSPRGSYLIAAVEEKISVWQVLYN